ncbi:calcium-binding protein [Methylocucumis oryzae]|uniref:Haemolysin-type calcium binding-related domain-containing protein n=1 Tax=Methylocucumis oryzae TaxID=1632867 RepID=A0A0F3ILF4_9GAMM|nr:hypothetical protein [Methylocucumis oryzae]KJV07497.1 hypothetical protein VZ94_04390 [Methylocucumis oryzae]
MAVKLGTLNDDDLIGTAANDVFLAHSGKDILIGNAGNDLLYFSSGSPTIFGGDGNDYIVIEGSTNAKVDAGSGNDIVLASVSSSIGGVKDSPAHTSLLDTSGGDGTDYLSLVLSGGYQFSFTMGSGLNSTLYTGTKISGFETGIIVGSSLGDTFTATNWRLDNTIFTLPDDFCEFLCANQKCYAD